MLLLFQVNFVFTVIRIFYLSSFREDLFPQFFGSGEKREIKD